MENNTGNMESTTPLISCINYILFTLKSFFLSYSYFPNCFWAL